MRDAEPPRTDAHWLALREPADAAARSVRLLEAARRGLPPHGTVVVHDLGCGTGSMGRWLAPRLPGPQHWVLHDRDEDLLALARAARPGRAADGARVTLETRRHDLTTLAAAEVVGATLVTASALTDLMTREEVRCLAERCAQARCPVLVTLNVTGRVELTPGHPLDQRLADAFNAHQRRTAHGRRLLGPDAPRAVVAAFELLGFECVADSSPWRLGPGQAALTGEWLAGWTSAAAAQQPRLRQEATAYARRRRVQAVAGGLHVTVDHLDLLALPPRGEHAAGG